MRMTRSERVYVALGNSSGAGVGGGGQGYPDHLVRKLADRGLPVTLRNLSQSGAVSLDVLESQVPRVEAMQPDLVTVGIGSNDILQGIPEEAFAWNLEQIALVLMRSTAQVVIANMPDLTLTPIAARFRAGGYSTIIADYNRHVEAVAARHGFILFDLFRLSQREAGQHADLFSADGFHPSSKGYERWAAGMLDPVMRALSLPPTQAYTGDAKPYSKLTH